MPLQDTLAAYGLISYSQQTRRGCVRTSEAKETQTALAETMHSNRT